MTSRPVHVVRAAPAFRATRGELVARLADADRTTALIGGGPGADGRFSVFCIRPDEEFLVPSGSAPVRPPRGVWGDRGDDAPDVFDRLRDLATRYRVVGPNPGLPFAGGVLAVLGFDLRTHVERLPDRHPPDPSCPDLLARLFSAVLVHDGQDDVAEVYRLADLEDENFTAAAADVAAELAIRGGSGMKALPPTPPPRGRPTCSDDPDGYRAKVAAVIEHVRAGDVYQLNLAQRFEGPCGLDAVGFMLRLLERNPAPFGGLVRLGPGAWLASASPERFFRVRNGVATTRPIKGTAPRGRDREEDERLLASLRGSPKERAELAMIVDLLRNDLSTTCRTGSVVVREAFIPESHPTVHHLTATVEGAIRPDRDVFDLVRAAWPGGSISGCPKIRALELIDRLESFRRGPYTGSLAAFSADGGADLNILIRSVLLVGDRAITWGGGGVTADSDPEAERIETLHKIRGLAAALNWELPA